MRIESKTKTLPLPTKEELETYFSTHYYKPRNVLSSLAFREIVKNDMKILRIVMFDIHTQVVKGTFVPTKLGKAYYHKKTVAILEQAVDEFLARDPYILKELNDKIHRIYKEANKFVDLATTSRENKLLNLAQRLRVPYDSVKDLSTDLLDKEGPF